MKETAPIVELKSIRKDFRVSGGNSLFPRMFTAVEDIGLRIMPGETFGIVGESGCGKTTVARLIMALEKPTSGEVWFAGQRIDTMPERQLRALRPHFQMVFQDSGSSLNPRKRVLEILTEPIRYHRTAPDPEKRADELMEMVGLPVEMKNRYPHEFSGGQRQRICIAKALSLNPEVIVLDEPVSALDVSVQAQILNLLRSLQEQMRLTYVFIGHGLGAVHYLSHRIAVMYRGRIVEEGPSDTLFNHPAHPYTRALTDAAPSADYALRDRPRVTLQGEVDTEVRREGCFLYPRCPYRTEDCLRHQHTMSAVGGDELHLSACSRASGS